MNRRRIPQHQNRTLDAVFTQSNAFVNTAYSKKVNPLLFHHSGAFHIAVPIAVRFDDCHNLACRGNQLLYFLYVM